MASKGLRAGVVGGGIVAAVALLALCASAQDLASSPANAPQESLQAPPTGVSFNDPGLTLSVHRATGSRFDATGGAPGEAANDHQVEMQVSASGNGAGVPLDVAFAHHDALDAAETGRDQRGSEIRIGHNLVQQGHDGRDRGPSVYAFIASDHQALTWAPGQRAALAMQDHQVNVGDHSAGVTYEANGIETSLAYVERKVSTRVGARGYSTDESFAGLTVTVRR